MNAPLTPAAVRDRATKAHTSINKLMARAGLPNSTFWRWEKGAIVNPHPVTLQKLSDALGAIEAERAA
jgi:transcriptional regulator with XRE-family HTH domain